MSTLSHGADAQRLRSIGQELSGSAQSMDDVSTSGRSMVEILVASWSGPDLEHFASSGWPQAEQSIHHAGESLRTMSEQLQKEADQQDDTSQGSGGGAGAGGSGGSSGSPGEGPAEEGQSRDADDYGELPDGMTEKWESYSFEEKQAIFRQIVREQAELYGIDPPPEIEWVDDPEYTSNGTAIGEDKIKINVNNMDDPMMLHTIYHEVRHNGQIHMINDQPGDLERWINDVVGRDDYPDGVTQEQVDEWEENFADGNYIDPGEDYDGYFDQPVEVDARESGSEGVEGISPDKTDELLEDGQRNDFIDRIWPF